MKIKASLPIGEKEIREAIKTLYEYRDGKHALDSRVIDDEEWFRMKRSDNGRYPARSSAWLFNSVMTKHAEAMDSFPRPSVLPREEGDTAEAEMLSSVLPVVLDNCDFESVYSAEQLTKIKHGTAVYGVYWNPEKGGMGDICISEVDVLSLFWEPGVENIQNSRNVFRTELWDRDLLEERYPQLKGKSVSSLNGMKYIYDNNISTDKKCAVVDWYYKKNGRLHFAKFVGEVLLFASENLPEYKDRGFYDHGMYPFITDILYPVKGSVGGFGFIDVGKQTQEYIDRGDSAILANMLAGARPRHFIRSDGSVNEAEYADMSRDFIHVDGQLGQDSIVPVQTKSLPEIYYRVVQGKIDELKETTGNRDVSTGGTSSGVTAASAIAALQEAGSKLSRDMTKGSYRAFRAVCYMVLELIRQFYTLPRCFRIMGEDGARRYVYYTNEGIRPTPIDAFDGTGKGYRYPMFDIEITAEKSSPYSRMSQNELALQFFGAGFFNPMKSVEALAALDMMDFDRKNFVMKKIAENAAAYVMTEDGLTESPVRQRRLGESKITEAARRRVNER